MKKSLFISVALIAAAAAYADAPYPETGDQSVCISEQAYGVDENAGSTYEWTISGTSEDRTIIDGATSGLKTVNWLKANTYTIEVKEKTADGCYSNPSSIKVTVSAKPEVENVTATPACSGDVISATLPVQDKSAAALTEWTLKSVDIPAGVTADPGNATPGTTTDKNFIASDKYTNNNSASATVVYHLTANGGGCESEEFTISVTIYKAVKTPVIYHN